MYTVPVGQNPSGLVCGNIQFFGPYSLSTLDHGTGAQEGHL